MLTKNHLFVKGHPANREPGLRDLLEGHKRSTLKKIRDISDLGQMTDSFLERLVKDSLVEPLNLRFDKMTQKIRTDNLDRSAIPHNSMAGRMLGRRAESDVLEMMGGQKQVARLFIPFTGDPALLQYTPSSCGTHLPHGDVSGHTLEFDVVLGNTPDDANRVKAEIKQNREMIAESAAKNNQQVKEFNESLPAQLKAAFTTKLEELTKQYAIFEDLGIPEQPEPPTVPSSPAPKKGKARAVQIIQNVETMIVQQLNQTNYNVGDVNNAIQSGE
jgi:hypothetical protein